MANENVIKVKFHVSGLATFTAKVLKPDGTVRVASVALTDSGHLYSYQNAGTVDIQAGDQVQAFEGAVFRGASIFKPDTSAVALTTTIASVTTADIKFVLTEGPAIADILLNAVVSILDVSSGVVIPRRVAAYSAGREVTLDVDAGFPLTAGDVVKVWADSYEGELGVAAAEQIADAVWEESMNDHKTPGTTGRKQSQIQAGFLP